MYIGSRIQGGPYETHYREINGVTYEFSRTKSGCIEVYKVDGFGAVHQLCPEGIHVHSPIIAPKKSS